MKRILVITVLIFVMMSGIAAADVETGWAMDKPNEYDGNHGVLEFVMVDFEDGTYNQELIVNTYSGIEFVTMDNKPWMYAKKGAGMNIYPHGCATYVVNGRYGAWCDTSGHQGMITFEDKVGHVSLLVSTFSGVEIDAYNKTGYLVAKSGRAEGNLNTMTTTRLSVDRKNCDISYVIVHDTGNYWLIDDLLVGYKSPGQSALAHCQKFIHNQNDDHWNEAAYTDKMNPCDDMPE